MNDQRTPRVAIVADDSGPMHGVPWTLTQLRERPLPGFALDVVRSERSIDAWALRRPDLVHLGSGGRTTSAARAAARALGLRTVVSHHSPIPPRDLSQPRLLLSPSASADRLLLQWGVAAPRIARWEPSVAEGCFTPARYAPGTLPEGFSVLHAGPLTRGHGLELLADAWLIARERNPRLRLVVAGDGPGGAVLRHRLGAAVTLVGPVGPEQLAQLYATADLFVTASTSDLFGQTILEAQASGLPVVAVDAGAAGERIESGRNGCLVPPQAAALAEAMLGLARRGALCDRLVTGGLVAAREHASTRSREQLAHAYARALAPDGLLAPTGREAEVARAA